MEPIDLLPLVSLLIPIVAIVMGVGLTMLIFYFHYAKRKHMFALYHQERMAAIEKGLEVPPLPDGFFSDDAKSPRTVSPHRHLLKGLILLFIGLILFFAFYNEQQIKPAMFSLVPGGIGLAYLIYYFAIGRKEAAAMEAAARTNAEEPRSVLPT